MTASTAAGSFHISGGAIFDPNGSVFVARGINVLEGNEPSASTLKADFPGINFVRLAIYDYQSAVNLQPYVDSLTNQGMVVELEDHANSTSGNAGGSQGTIFSGGLLTTELNWYSSVASTFKDDPYVWFGTNNEPSEIDSSGNTNPAALSTWQQQTYNAVRNAGNNSPVLLEANSGGPSNTNTGYVASAYAGMKNVVWDVHFYGWLSGYSTNQSTVSNTLSGIAGAAQKITSADGTIPVIIGEYGNSTDGQTIDANGSQVISAVQNSKYGNVAWAYLTGNGDALITSSGSLSSFGQEVAGYITSAAKSSAGSASTTGTTTVTAGIVETANNSVVVAGTAASLKDASGNLWTIANSGTVAMNGAAAGFTANVKEIALVNGTIWQENSGGLWWNWTGAGWSSGSGTATSPVKASADGTVLTASSASVITDGSGNSWSIANNGTVYENGTAAAFTAGVKEIAIVNGTIWQENTGGLWWSWGGTGWGTGSGTATSPVKTSANKTAVMASSGYAIIDSSGNTWTISSTGTVSQNGSAAGYTANVKEIAFVNGTIWQENTAGLWWKWTGSAWGSGSGTATSPLS